MLAREQIRLVDEEEVLLLRLGLRSSLGLLTLGGLDVELENVLGEVLGAEGEGVSRVDDLDDEVGSLEGAPELSPNFEVSLKGREEEGLVVLETERARKRLAKTPTAKGQVVRSLTLRDPCAIRGTNPSHFARALRWWSCGSRRGDEGLGGLRGSRFACGSSRALVAG